MKDRVKEYVKSRSLDKPDRHREKNYERIILASILREENVSYMDIGRIMKRNHATIINMMKNYEWLKKYSDFRKLEKSIKAQLKHYTIEERVLQVDNMAELHWLQEEIKKSLEK
jgi:hypothetical protein